MATQTIPIIGSNSRPADSNVFWQPFSLVATNDVFDFMVLTFNDGTTRHEYHGGFVVPNDYSTTPKVQIYWTTTATSGDAEWDFDYRGIAVNNSESLDPSTVAESLNQNDTAGGTALDFMMVEFTLTASNLAAGDFVPFILARDKSDAGDTISAAVHVAHALFKYDTA